MTWFIRSLWIVLATSLLSGPTHAANKSWRGGFPSLNWSDPDNWSPKGVPQNGDSLSFHATVIPGAGHIGITVNDIPNLTVAKLNFSFNADFQTQEWYILGEHTLGISGPIELAGSTDEFVEIQCGLRLEANTTFLVNFSAVDSDLKISGPVDLNGHTLTLSADDITSTLGDSVRQQIEIAGPITGTGNLRLVPGGEFGTVKLSGSKPNTFNGTVTLSNLRDDGTQLVLDKQNGPAIPGSLIVGTNSEVIWLRDHQIADSSTVNVAPGGGLRLNNHDDLIFSLSLEETALPRRFRDFQVDTGDGTLWVSGQITALNTHPTLAPTIRGRLGLPEGIHAVQTTGNPDFALNIEANMVGPGGILKQGSKGLILAGNNSFGGDLDIRQGLVQASHANALGAPSGAVILNGGELELSNAGIGNKSLWVNQRSDRTPDWGGLLNILGTCSWAGPITLNIDLTVTGGIMSFLGGIDGTAGLRLLFNDRITLAGTTPNTFTGPTWSDSTLLLLNKSPGVSAFLGPLVVNPAAGPPAEVQWQQDYQCVGADVTLYEGGIINIKNRREDFGPITFQGGTIDTGASGELGIYGLLTVNTSPTTATILGRVGLPPGLHEFRIHNGSAFPDLRIDALILGPGSLRKTGQGQIWTTQASIYTGLTTVAEGVMSVLHPDGLGAAATGTTVQEGATLELNFVGTMPEPIALRGQGQSGQSALGVFGEVTLRNPFPSIFAPLDLTSASTIGVAPNAFLIIDGTLTGVGPLHKRGAGTLRFAGNDHNTYTGDTQVEEGTVILAKPSGTTAIPGTLYVGSEAGLTAMVGNAASYQVIGNIFVQRNGLYHVNGQIENVDHLWLLDGGDVATSTGVLFLKSGGSIHALPGPSGDASIITGNLDLDASAHLIHVDPVAGAGLGLVSVVQLQIDATISSSLGAIQFLKQGLGVLRLTGNNTYTGPTQIHEGTLQIDGTQTASPITVHRDAQLFGNGRVGSVLFATSRPGTSPGILNPGIAPGANGGILTCSSLNSDATGGILHMDLTGNSPGKGGYDQLQVGSGRLANVRLDGMTLDVTLNFPSKVNDSFVLIQNNGFRSSVTGTFQGLPEGASVCFDNEQFVITYVGGDGNDVVLTRVPTPASPTLRIVPVSPLAVQLSWSANFPNYTLVSVTNLTSTNWSPVLPPPSLLGTNLVVTNLLTGPRRFYRLQIQ